MLSVGLQGAPQLVVRVMVADQEPGSSQRSVSPGIAEKHDRRRSGRVEVNPALIPLLRRSALLAEPVPVRLVLHEHTTQASFDFRTEPSVAEQAHLTNLDDGGNPGRAIILALLISMPFWAVMAATCYWLLA